MRSRHCRATRCGVNAARLRVDGPASSVTDQFVISLHSRTLAPGQHICRARGFSWAPVLSNSVPHLVERRRADVTHVKKQDAMRCFVVRRQKCKFI